MKKALKIIIPILLILVVLGSVAWYLLIYDSSFTQELLLQQARKFESNGNHSAAVFVYDLAYSQSGEDDQIAIELAHQFKDIGNYTKAEYTLSNAIADGATTELYIELCKTYVEQDKLLDAVKMLENIENAEIKAELDAMRPAAPVADPVEGFYNEYVNLWFHSAEGTLYVTTDGTYPSTANDPYTQEITLPAGETTVYALSVADNGLVSPVTICTYTVVGVIEPVSFQDPAIEAMIRQQLNYSQDTVIYTNDLWNITELTVPEDTTVYADLAGMTNLKSLTVHSAATEDFSFLSKLKSLEKLEISGVSLSDNDLTVIGASIALTDLSLTDCNLSSITPLAGLHNLVRLDLSGNSIRDLTALTNMHQLEQLHLSYNAVNSIGVVSSLPELRVLDLSYNNLNSIATIGTCVAIEELDVTHNKLSDISAVGNLKKLKRFAASENTITDVSALSACPELTDLNISSNNVADISLLSNLSQLMYFNFSNNSVTVLPAWSVDCALVTIDGSYNQISSVEELRDLYNLNRVNMDYNTEIESIDPLEGCPALVQVDVYGTKVTEVSALTAHSIIVNFDPTSISVDTLEETGENYEDEYDEYSEE